MKTSCGILIINEQKEILLGTVTGANGRLDIPKGLLEEGEQAKDCALRECFEETGYTLQPERLKELGLYTYLAGKNLHLFEYRCKKSEIDLAEFKCISFFTQTFKSGKSVEKPEILGVQWVPFDKLEGKVSKNLLIVLRTIVG